MTLKPKKPENPCKLSEKDIFIKAAEIQQRMYMEWDEEAINHIAAELLQRQNKSEDITGL